MRCAVRWLILALFCLGTAAAVGRDEPVVAPRPYEPTDRYQVREIGGWEVLVNTRFAQEQPELCGRTLTLLESQLYQIRRRLPADAVATLQQVRIWVERAEGHHPCMAYHPDAGWLRAHDMNPDKAGCVELANAANFLRWTIDQPWMVLHELAHAYHHQFLPDGFANPDVRRAFEAAREAKHYEAVLRINGRTERAYALTNPMEYFSEATEAYFGTNDFYPYVRSELREADPMMHDVLGRLWSDARRK